MKWVSVYDELPEIKERLGFKSEDVLVYTENGSFLLAQRNINGLWQLWNGKALFDETTVSHWAYLEGPDKEKMIEYNKVKENKGDE
jgi:hypothetical protein